MPRPSSTNLQYLTVRKDTGKFVYWRTLPPEIAPISNWVIERSWTTKGSAALSGSIIKISLQTGDAKQARDRWSAVHTQIENRLARLRSAIHEKTQQSQQTELALERRAKLSPSELETVAGQLRHDILAADDQVWIDPKAAQPMAQIIAGFLAGEGGSKTADVMKRARAIASILDRRATAHAIDASSTRVMDQDLVARERHLAKDDRISVEGASSDFAVPSELTTRLAENGIALDNGDSRTLAAITLLRAKSGALQTLQRRKKGDDEPTPTRPDLIRGSDIAQDDPKNPRLSDMLEKWKKDTSPSPKNYDDRAIYITRFIAIHGDLRVKEITKSHIIDFRDYHEDMPRNIPHFLRNSHPDEMKTWAASNPTQPKLSRSTINNKVIASLSAVLGQAAFHGFRDQNPAFGTKFGGKKSGGKKTVVSISKLPFTDEHLKKMFALALFTPPHKVPKAARGEAGFWIPLIALFSGMRLEEIGQMHVADVRQKAGIDYFDVTTLVAADEDEDHAEAYVKSLKTNNARREVPLHPALKALGFLDYVSDQRSAGSIRLFPQLTEYKGRYSKNLSRWWGRFQDKNVTASKHYTFHSFRHTFVSAMKDAGIQKSIWQGIIGHAGGDVSDSYGLPHALKLRAEMIAKVDYPSVDFDRIQRPKVER
jgi:integrase